MTNPRAIDRLRAEHGFVTGFMIRTALILLLVGLAVVDGGAIIFARLQAQDVAESAAAEAAGVYKNSGNQQAAITAAATAVADKDPNARLVRRSVRFDNEGRVHLLVRKQAPTVVVQRIGFLDDLHVATGSAVGDPPAF